LKNRYAYKRLLGFDAREGEQDCKNNPLPIEVCERLLLRPEIECPCSVDSNIWPSHFLYYPQIKHLIGSHKPPLIEADSDCRGGLWLNLDTMRERLREHKRSAVPVAIELYVEEEDMFNDYPSPLVYSKTTPPGLPSDNVFLGYDVADSGFCSGLSNAGYSQEERNGLSPRWREHINNYGLLNTQENAFRFKEISDERIPEHAPFWVYGVYRVR